MEDRPTTHAVAGVHEKPVYIAAAILVVSTLLSWYHFDFESMGEAGELGQMFASMALMGGSESVAGLKTNPGLIVLLAALACAGVTWAHASGALSFERSHVLLAAAGLAGIAAVAVLYACFATDGPVAASFGLYVAFFSAGALAWFTVRRVVESAPAKPVPGAGAN